MKQTSTQYVNQQLGDAQELYEEAVINEGPVAHKLQSYIESHYANIGKPIPSRDIGALLVFMGMTQMEVAGVPTDRRQALAAVVNSRVAKIGAELRKVSGAIIDAMSKSAEEKVAN